MKQTSVFTMSRAVRRKREQEKQLKELAQKLPKLTSYFKPTVAAVNVNDLEPNSPNIDCEEDLIVTEIPSSPRCDSSSIPEQLAVVTSANDQTSSYSLHDQSTEELAERRSTEQEESIPLESASRLRTPDCKIVLLKQLSTIRHLVRQGLLR